MTLYSKTVKHQRSVSAFIGNNFCKLKWKFWYWLVNSLSSVCSTFFHLSDVSVPLWLVLPAGPSDSAPHFASSSPQPCPPLLSAPRHPSKPGGIKNNNIWEGPYIKCARSFLAFFDPLPPPARILHAFGWPPLRKCALKAITPPNPVRNISILKILVFHC